MTLVINDLKSSHPDCPFCRSRRAGSLARIPTTLRLPPLQPLRSRRAAGRAADADVRIASLAARVQPLTTHVVERVTVRWPARAGSALNRRGGRRRAFDSARRRAARHDRTSPSWICSQGADIPQPELDRVCHRLASVIVVVWFAKSADSCRFRQSWQRAALGLARCRADVLPPVEVRIGAIEQPRQRVGRWPSAASLACDDEEAGSEQLGQAGSERLLREAGEAKFSQRGQRDEDAAVVAPVEPSICPGEQRL